MGIAGTGPVVPIAEQDWSDVDRHWMRRALALAGRAESEGEVPVGAVVVAGAEALGEGWNRPISAQDPTAHAEVVALRQAARRLGNYRLPDATLYVTLEPCPMCAGAMLHARLARVVIGARDPRSGAAGSVVDLLDSPRFNHRCEVSTGLFQADSSKLLRRFFQSRRGSRAGVE